MYAHNLGVNISNIIFKVNTNFYSYDESQCFHMFIPFDVNLSTPDHTLKK